MGGGSGSGEKVLLDQTAQRPKARRSAAFPSCLSIHHSNSLPHSFKHPKRGCLAPLAPTCPRQSRLACGGRQCESITPLAKGIA